MILFVLGTAEEVDVEGEAERRTEGGEEGRTGVDDRGGLEEGSRTTCLFEMARTLTDARLRRKAAMIKENIVV